MSSCRAMLASGAKCAGLITPKPFKPNNQRPFGSPRCENRQLRLNRIESDAFESRGGGDLWKRRGVSTRLAVGGGNRRLHVFVRELVDLGQNECEGHRDFIQQR